MIYFYDDKHAQFPSYTTENALSYSLQDLSDEWRQKQALQSKTQHTVLSFHYNFKSRLRELLLLKTNSGHKTVVHNVMVRFCKTDFYPS